MHVSEDYAKNRTSLLLINYVICALLGSELSLANVSISGQEMAVGLALVNGLFYITGFVFFQYNITKNGVSYSSIFQRLGVLIPTILSIVIFKDIPTIFQIIGFSIGLIAIIAMNFKNTSIPHPGSLLILLCVGGLGDFMSKIFTELGISSESNQFLFYTFFFAMLYGIILVMYRKEKITKNELLFGTLIGIPNYYCSKFLLLAVGSLPAMVVYPMFSVSTIVINTFVGTLIFKEKLTKQSMIAIVMMLVSIALLNI